MWLRVRLPYGHTIKNNPDQARGGIVPDPPIADGPLVGEGIDELTMTVPDEWGPTEIRLTEGGVLDDLRLLASRVAREAGWTEEEAVRFILTGSAPVIPLVDTQDRRGNRVTLSLHPSVTPSELATAYGAMRRERGLSQRRLSDKHASLAAFVERRPKLGGSETWAVRMKAWNTEHSRLQRDWRYTRHTNFARDSSQAQRRMEERNEASRAG